VFARRRPRSAADSPPKGEILGDDSADGLHVAAAWRVVDRDGTISPLSAAGETAAIELADLGLEPSANRPSTKPHVDMPPASPHVDPGTLGGPVPADPSAGQPAARSILLNRPDSDAGLARVIDAWALLPDNVRTAIVTLVEKAHQ